MFRIFWVSALLAGLWSPAQAGELAKVTLDVPSMNCSLCPIAVTRVLRKQPGVRDASASLETKSAVVDFDPSLTSPAQLARAVSNAGYPATPRKP
ncbi:MAG TPA: heavy metal-associated domain-containing protein [Burkholderiales bacterium]|nr:heavy metal-associated domain-containing protein [Burkholderiales bacterium]